MAQAVNQPLVAAKDINKRKLTLTNIVEEEISPTSKSSISNLSKPKSGRVNQPHVDAAEKSLNEEDGLHSGNIERYLLG